MATKANRASATHRAKEAFRLWNMRGYRMAAFHFDAVHGCRYYWDDAETGLKVYLKGDGSLAGIKSLSVD